MHRRAVSAAGGVTVMKITIMKSDRVRTPHCIDCGIDTDAIDESYMIHDELWRAVNPAEAGMALRRLL